MLTYESLIPLLDARVADTLPLQVVDDARDDCGAFVSAGEGMAGSSFFSMTVPLGYAYLLEESRYHGRMDVLERILLACEYVRPKLASGGRFDLITTNFDSAPDSAFIVQAVAPVVKAARQAGEVGDKGAGEMAEALGEIIQTAAPGIVTGGFHTPNHRWVIVSALAQARELFPDLDVMETIDAYLAEGIDINEDGEYTERSTGVYNAICNRSLRLAADALGRPELLEPVRRNLDMSYHLLHADGTVVTSISSRQDRGQRTVPVGLADSYYTLGRREENGFYLAAADWLFDLTRGGIPWILQPLVEHPEWRTDDAPREPLPGSYTKVYPTSGLWRVRRDEMTATAAAGITSPFSLQFGEARLRAVKLSSTYFATGQFVGEAFRTTRDGVAMRHEGADWLHKEKRYDRPIYWMPIPRKVTSEEWTEVRAEREVYSLPPLKVDLGIREVEGGFDLHVATTGGVDGVPFQIECVFEPGGTLEFESGIVEGQADATAFLKSGHCIYRVGSDAISVGPGEYAHRMWHMRNSEPSPGSFRVLITSVTPVDRVLEIRCGKWSEGMGAIV